jgi:glyoxylase-like metal-dependent hydrolase (beta-lactamase superfamily II)
MLRVQGFTFNPFQENTYLLISENKQCAIIDPGTYSNDERRILREFIEKEELQPILLLNTHCHIDHVFGNKFISETYGLRPQIPAKELPLLTAVPRIAELYGLNYDPSPEPDFIEGDEIEMDGERLRVLEVPGHSPGHIALYNEEGKFLIAGDVLFKRSIGRTDLPGGDMDTLLHSIRSQFFTLPDETLVYPGHMETTDIGSEKRLNPFLHQG